ncbi:MAG TPA: hypothetical protein VFZ27_12545 [Terriglobia bacterium]|nr:hypothetical protein [Terriglobia bacterium]
MAASLWMQFILIVLMASGAVLILRKEEGRRSLYHNPDNVPRYLLILIPFSLGTMGMLLFSDQFSVLTRPLFSGIQIGLIRWPTAILWVFIADIACTAILVLLTGGSYGSPFTSVYFILPALAFFLRESPQRVLAYTLAIGALFVIELWVYEEETKSVKGAVCVVSVGCLILSGWIGYLTRPH